MIYTNITPDNNIYLPYLFYNLKSIWFRIEGEKCKRIKNDC